MKKENIVYENLQTNIRGLRLPEIEVWENMYPERDYWVEMVIPEFTCICPKTGLPDFAVIKVKYRPQRFCLELKSFKYYINSYRDVGIFHEHVVNKIMQDLVKACSPKQMIIEGIFNSRGGIQTSVLAEYKKK